MNGGTISDVFMTAQQRGLGDEARTFAREEVPRQGYKIESTDMAIDSLVYELSPVRMISHKGTMLQSATGEELRLRALRPSVLRPQGGAFDDEL
jgi:hypothetical protein